jgi:hypothetical protein
MMSIPQTSVAVPVRLRWAGRWTRVPEVPDQGAGCRAQAYGLEPDRERLALYRDLWNAT